jgi:hypothetical protein
MCDVVRFSGMRAGLSFRVEGSSASVFNSTPKPLGRNRDERRKQHHEKQDGSTIRHKREQDPGAAVPVACESFSSGKIYGLLVLRPERCRRRTPRPPPFSSINSTPLRVSAT